MRQKCLDLKLAITHAERMNQMRAIAINRAQHSLAKLQYEYSLLLETLERKALKLPLADLKALKPEDIDGKSIESIDINDIKQLLNSSSDDELKKYEGLDVYNRIKDHLENQNQIVNSSTATPAGKKRSTNSHNAGPPSKKKTRDPREPKRPTNAYLYYCDAERDNLKTEWLKNHPNEHMELTKITTEGWKNLTEEQKKPYFDMFEKDKERYQNAMKEFNLIKERENGQTPEVSEIPGTSEPPVDIKSELDLEDVPTADQSIVSSPALTSQQPEEEEPEQKELKTETVMSLPSIVQPIEPQQEQELPPQL